MKISDGLIQRLQKTKERALELGEELSKSEVVTNQELFRNYSKELSDLTPIVEAYDEYLNHKKNYDECIAQQSSETDPEMKEMIADEIDSLIDAMDKDAETIKIALIPKDPNEDSNVIIEFRAGVGGEEAALFATELMKMYEHYADKNRWKMEEVSSNMTEIGGIKEAVYTISGHGAYGKLKFESGVHRVQRVPETESQGRVHTSAATVAVLPEVEDIQVDIKPEDVKIDTYRSSGAGGQHVNKTESAIRMTHIPTGIVVECQDERSQMKNREKAWAILRSRVYDMIQTQNDKEYAENRRAQIGSGDRSERIRTYNFPQGRVTDHRIGLTLYSLDRFMMGELDEMITALQIALQNKMLENIDD